MIIIISIIILIVINVTSKSPVGDRSVVTLT